MPLLRDAGPQPINPQRGANAPPSGGAQPELRGRNEIVLRNPGCALSFRGKRAEKDLCVPVSTAAMEAMAMGVRGLRLWRVAPGGSAGWSEFERPWRRGARPREWCLSRLGLKRVLGGSADRGRRRVSQLLLPSPRGSCRLSTWKDKSVGARGCGRAGAAAGPRQELRVLLGRNPRPVQIRPCLLMGILILFKSPGFGVWKTNSSISGY